MRLNKQTLSEQIYEILRQDILTQKNILLSRMGESYIKAIRKYLGIL